jgi:hypothetical protein
MIHPLCFFLPFFFPQCAWSRIGGGGEGPRPLSLSRPPSVRFLWSRLVLRRSIVESLFSCSAVLQLFSCCCKQRDFIGASNLIGRVDSGPLRSRKPGSAQIISDPRGSLYILYIVYTPVTFLVRDPPIQVLHSLVCGEVQEPMYQGYHIHTHRLLYMRSILVSTYIAPVMPKVFP